VNDVPPPPDAQATLILEDARRATLAALETVDAETLSRLSRLTLPEIREIQEEVARILPAGNLPALILSGLVQLKGRRVDAARAREDITAMLRGMNLLPQGLYSLFVAGPATALYAYQKLLQLAGREPAEAFPQGTWQFYLQFGLREDEARHANETLGFHRALPPGARDEHQAAAWLLAAVRLLYAYEDLLATDWRERVMLHVLRERAEEAGTPLPRLVRDWNAIRPYHRPAPDVPYLRYRIESFEAFLAERTQSLSPKLRAEVRQAYARRQGEELEPYLEQMTLLAALRPKRHREEKEPLPLWQAAVAFIWGDRCYLLPACRRDPQGRPYHRPSGGEPRALGVGDDGQLYDGAGRQILADRRGRTLDEEGQFVGTLCPPEPGEILAWVRAIVGSGGGGRSDELADRLLAAAPRREQEELRALLPEETQRALAELRKAPVVVNWDRRPHDRPLGEVRRARRGVGDHALTVLRTPRSIVFDQSHIFFDGMWGMAVAEILTGEATHACRALLEGSPQASAPPVPRPLPLALPPQLATRVEERTRRVEVNVESDEVNPRAIARLRAALKQRGVRLTVNDLLLLYRALHAATYDLRGRLEPQFEAFRQGWDPATYAQVRREIETTLRRCRETNPALLIPMDASNVSPRERLFPTTFRNPLPEILPLFEASEERLLAYRQSPRGEGWPTFDTSRRELLAYLKAFGEVLAALKEVTMRGQSFNTATLQLLGHLPPSLQHLLDVIPQRIGMLNEVLKGNEVFSNVGRVAKGSTLHRFMSARDDGRAKELVWGVMTDDAGVMHVNLRDFRPFVPELWELGEEELAVALAQDYLNRYARGLNSFANRLHQIVTAQPPA
jgi:hypothetical protein